MSGTTHVDGPSGLTIRLPPSALAVVPTATLTAWESTAKPGLPKCSRTLLDREATVNFCEGGSEERTFDVADIRDALDLHC
mmetsp:Transcript_3436/g.7114  ORF Transcript_3436/g.7114 Transcript_3436/m.7114 type:complete len:81 (-) Transcript_3436:199-441(-)